MNGPGPLVTTYSIVGYDPVVPAWGIAIASKFLAVGAKTCWGAGDAGVVVLQAHLNARNGPEGVELLRRGLSAGEVVDRLMTKDPHRDLRQMAAIDRQGGVATYTGSKCGFWAGAVTGEQCAAQGNMLLGGEGCQAMVEHFTSADGSLARRLVDALAIGDEVAGDSRGRQAAALYVVRPAWTEPFDVFTEPTIDLRVDDAENPYSELSRLLDLWELLYLPTAPEERLPMDGTTVRRFQRVLARFGFYNEEPTGVLDDVTRAGLQKLARMENFRRRLASEEWFDGRLLEYLEARVGL